MGGYFQPNTSISGVVGAPGIPFFNSPTGGFFETNIGGFGFSLSGQSYQELGNAYYQLGYKNPSVFTLAALAGSPFSTNGSKGVAISPNGLFVFAADYDLNTVSAYLRNSTTGSLTLVASYASGTNPEAVVVSKDNLHVVVTPHNDNSIRVFSINQITGALTAVAGSPFAGGGGAGSVTFSPNGKYLIATTTGAEIASVFSYNAVTGALAAVAGSPFATGGAGVNAVATTPNSNFIFATNGVSNNITVFSFNPATGFLTPVAGSPFACPGNVTNGICLRADGLVAFVASSNAGLHNIAVFNIDPATGKLTAIAGSPFASVSNLSVAITPDNQHLILGGGGLTTSAYSIDSFGALTPITGSPFVAPHEGRHIVVSPDGNHIYAVSYAGAGSLYGFQTQTILTYPLVSALFDPTGLFSGVFNVNGTIMQQGLPVAQAGVSLTSQYVGSSGGGTVAYTLTPAIPLTSYADGQLFLFKANATNTTALATFAVSGLGALPATKGNVAMPAGGMVIGNYYWGLVELGGTSFRISPFDAASVNGDTINGEFDFVVAGKGLKVSEAANGKQGVAALVAGTVVVANTSITANSRIILSPQETGLLTGIVRVSARTANVSFTLTSTITTDTAVIAYEIFEPG